MPDEAQPPNPNALTRRDLEVVIRRAVELSLEESDASDNISEDELIRIAGELGISPRHVRQALFEKPVEPPEEGFLDRNFGPTVVTVSRMVPCPQQVAHGRLEDYLVTNEYLQIRRKQGAHAYFEPAEDAFSSIARSFSRPSSRFHLARAQKAYLTVRSVDDKSCFVRLELNYAEKRKEHVQLASMLGGFVALLSGGAVAGAVTVGIDLGAIGAGAGILAGGATAGGVFALIWNSTKKGYRKWLGRSHEEADSLLDRLEHNDTLQPPASPWLRRLQQKLRGGGGR